MGEDYRVKQGNVICVRHGAVIAKVREGSLRWFGYEKASAEDLAERKRRKEAGEWAPRVKGKLTKYLVALTDLPQMVAIPCTKGHERIEVAAEELRHHSWRKVKPPAPRLPKKPNPRYEPAGFGEAPRHVPPIQDIR